MGYFASKAGTSHRVVDSSVLRIHFRGTEPTVPFQRCHANRDHTKQLNQVEMGWVGVTSSLSWVEQLFFLLFCKPLNSPFHNKQKNHPQGIVFRLCLRPPGLAAVAEVRLRPRREHDGVLLVNLDVRESKAERRGSTDLESGRVVLRAVARAHELVLRGVPRHDASQVRAHGVQSVLLDRLVLLDNQVRGIALQALREGVIARQVGLQPRRLLDVVAVGILRRLTSTTTAGAVRTERYKIMVSRSVAVIHRAP